MNNLNENLPQVKFKGGRISPCIRVTIYQQLGSFYFCAFTRDVLISQYNIDNIDVRFCFLEQFPTRYTVLYSIFKTSRSFLLKFSTIHFFFVYNLRKKGIMNFDDTQIPSREQL